MDNQLQQLKRQVIQNPGDTDLMQRYIAALERAVGVKQLALETCGSCPHKTEERWYTPDSWENVFQWLCTKTERPKPGCAASTDVANSSRIGYEEDGKSPTVIPSWCPLRVEQ